MKDEVLSFVVKLKTYKKGYMIDAVESEHDTSFNKESNWRFKKEQMTNCPKS